MYHPRALPTNNPRTTLASPSHHPCITLASPTNNPRTTHALPTHHPRITLVSPSRYPHVIAHYLHRNTHIPRNTEASNLNSFTPSPYHLHRLLAHREPGRLLQSTHYPTQYYPGSVRTGNLDPEKLYSLRLITTLYPSMFSHAFSPRNILAIFVQTHYIQSTLDPGIFLREHHYHASSHASPTHHSRITHASSPRPAHCPRDNKKRTSSLLPKRLFFLRLIPAKAARRALGLIIKRTFLTYFVHKNTRTRACPQPIRLFLTKFYPR